MKLGMFARPIAKLVPNPETEVRFFLGDKELTVTMSSYGIAEDCWTVQMVEVPEKKVAA